MKKSVKYFMILHAHKLSLLSLVENKLSTSSIDNLQTKLPAWNVINDTGSKGRILVLLHKTVWEYVAMSCSQQHNLTVK